MRRFQSFVKALSVALLFSLPAIAGAQTPVALPYTMTTVGGGLAARTTYTASSTVCPGASSTEASSSYGDNCAAVSGIFGAAGRGGVAVDQYGNVVVADDIDAVVHMIDPNTGAMTVVAGGIASLPSACSSTATTNSAGATVAKLSSAGDGCLASTQTVLSHPRGIGLDAYGNVLIPEYGQNLIHIVCRYASPLCTAGVPAPTAPNPIQVQVGYMGIVAGCAAANTGTGSSAVGLDGKPGFATSSSVNTSSYPTSLSTFKVSSCSTSNGTVEAPRAAWGDIYGNIYYADTSSSRTRVILGPLTSSYFSGNNPLYAALEVNTYWTSSNLKPGYVYTIVNVQGNSTSSTTAVLTSLSNNCLTAIKDASGTVNYGYAGSSKPLDYHADGCPFFDSSITASSGYTDTAATDAAGNLIFTDPGSGGLLRVFFVQGWASSSAANTAGATGSVASAGVAMYNAILKNNPGITPAPGYIYALAGAAGQGMTATALGVTSTTTLSTAPALGNAVTNLNTSINKLAISPQGNIYIGDGSSVLFYDMYNGTIRTLLTSGSSSASILGGYCSGSSGAVAKSPYWDGCPASKAYWGNSNALGLSVDEQGNLYLYDSNGNASGMLVRKVLAQGTGTASTGTLNALASSYSSAYPLQSLGTKQTQTFLVHFPVASSASAQLFNSTNPDFSYGTPSCTWYGSGSYTDSDKSMDCLVTVTYTPTAAGSQTAQMTLTELGSPYEVITLNLAGTVAGSVLAIDNATSAGNSVQSTVKMFSYKDTPTSIAVDGIGNLYAGLNYNNSYSIAESIVGYGGAGVASYYPAKITSVAVDPSGNIYFLLNGTSTIQERVVTSAGIANGVADYFANNVLTYYPSGLGTANPTALATDAAGNLYVADDQNGASTIYKISPPAVTNLTAATCNLAGTSGSILPTLCQSTISSVGAFGMVSALAVDPAGNVYVADTTNNTVYKLAPGVSNGVYTYTESTVASVAAAGLATDAAGDLYVESGSTVTMYPLSGPTTAGVTVYSGITTPAGVAVDGAGNVYVADGSVVDVTELQRGAITENFGTSTTTQFAATLTNIGNQASATVTSAGSIAAYSVSGGSSNGCTFSSNMLAGMNAGAACTMTAEFPGFGTPNSTITGYELFGATLPASTVVGELTLTGTAIEEGFNTTVSIGTASSTSPVYAASGIEVSYPITVTAAGSSPDGKSSITSGPTASNYITVSIDSQAATTYNFTGTSGLSASVTVPLSGLTAGVHTLSVSFPLQSQFMSSAGSTTFTISQQPTALNWTPSANSQQVSAPVGTGVLDAAISTSVAGNVAYAYGAAPSCTTINAIPGSTPIDASTYLPIGSYTLYATFCPTDPADYANATASISYSVTQASTTAAVGASTMVVAPSGGNYTSLSAALAALPTTGGTIYIAPGIYTGQNAISYPNVALRGLGGDPTQVILTAENGAFSSGSTIPAYYVNGSTTAISWGLGVLGKGGDEGSSTLDIDKSAYMGQTKMSATYTPNNFYAEYLTIQNTYNTSATTTTYYNTSGGSCALTTNLNTLQTLYNNGTECNSQAIALFLNADQAILNNVNLLGGQDTFYSASGGCGTYCMVSRQYLWKGTIVGNVDYVFGDAATVFDHTNFFTTWHGWVPGNGETIEAQNKKYPTGTTSTTNSSYPTSSDYLSGYIFNSDTLMSQSTGMSTLYYGRPWGTYSTAIMLNNNVDQVATAGWSEFTGDTNLPTSTYAEFNSKKYADPTPGTYPYPFALFNPSPVNAVPSLLYTSDSTELSSGYALYYANTSTTYTSGTTTYYPFDLYGGNTGSYGVNSSSSTPAAREANAIALTAGTAAPYYPYNFLSTTVPATKMPLNQSSNWNPLAAIAAQVNAYVPSAAINPIAYGASVTILARPQTPGAGVIPTGAYTLYDSVGTNQVCTAASASCTLLSASGATLNAAGEAYLTTSSLAAGTHYITMVYSGDTNFAGSSSSTYPITVLASGIPATTTTMSVANPSSTYGAAITGTVSVAPTAAAGSVTIYVDSASVASCTLSSGSCSWSVSNVAIGSHTIYASYSGNSSYGASNSPTATINVSVAAATGDTRAVTEPGIPAVCKQLTPHLTTDPAIQDLDATVDANTSTSNPSNPDGATIQAALNACAGTGQAVELSMDSTGTYNAFLSGPLTMPSNVTLLVDPNVTLYFSRNAQDYDKVFGTHTCGTISGNSASSSCLPLIDIPKTSTNVGIMGYGKLNGRGGDVLLNAFATSGYSYPTTTTPSWWDLAGAASTGSQQNPRFIEMDSGSSNITLYKITILNAPMFHVATGGSVADLTVWDIKISSPTYARNTDGIDPGDVINATIANSWVSDGDDDVAVGAANTPAANISVINNHFYAGHGESIGSYTYGQGSGVSNILFDGNMLAGNDVAGAGSAINASPATIAGTTYSANYADGNSTAIRIKTANDRGGLVTGIQYSNSCFLNHKSDIQFTPYYSSGDSTTELPSYTKILLQNLVFLNSSSSYGTVEMDGEYNTNNGSPIDNPLGITLDNVTFPSALSSLVNSTAPAESSATSSVWGTNYSGGTGQYVNMTFGPGQVSSNFETAYINLTAAAANNDILTNNISQPALNPTNCVFTYIAPELTGPNGVAQTVTYGSTANVDVILTPIVSGSAYPTGSYTVTDTTTGNSFTGTLSTTTDTQILTIPASDLTIGTHTFNATYKGDSNYTIPSSYQTFGSYNITVTQATPAVTVSPVTINYGTATATLTASIAYAGSAAPTGAATFTVDSGTAVTATCAGSATPLSCTASYDTSALTAGNHTITASVAADANYNSASGSNTLTVNQIAPGVTVSPVTINYGTATATLTASIAYAGSAAPTGAVTFTVDSGTAVTATCAGSATPLSCTASYTTSTLTGGSHTITANLTADTNYAAASGTGTLTVNKIAPGVTASAVTINYGAVTATLSSSIAYAGSLAPTGAVTFTVDRGAAVTATCTGSATPLSCSASYTTPSLTAGGHSITASVAADTNYTAATGSNTLTVNKIAPGVTASSVTINYGAATATLSSSIAYTGSSAPTGAVTFTVDSGAAVTATCTGSATPVSCTASYTTSALTGGGHTITANVAADANYTAATGSNTLTVNKIAPGVTASAVTINYGAVTATLSSSIAYAGSLAPTGGVTFTVDSGAAVTATCTGSATPLNCTASYSTSAFTGGNHTITTSIAADANYTAASGSNTLTVNKIAPGVTVSPVTINYGTAAAKLTSSVAYTGSSAPTGGVTFTVDNGTAVTATCTGSATPLACTASYATSSLIAGSHSITVSMAADANYTAATSTGTLTVNQISPLVSLATSSAIMVVQNPITLTATVSSPVSTPVGSVNFQAAGTSLGSCTLANGSCYISTSALAVGSYSITAVYSGDTNFYSVTSSAQTESIITFNIGTATPGIDSTGFGGGATQIILPAGKASWDMPIYPSSGNTLPIALTLSVSGLPSGATASLSPSSLWTQTSSTTWTLPAGTSMNRDTVLDVSVPRETASNMPGNVIRSGRIATLALLLLPFAGRIRRASKRLGRMMTVLVMLAAGLAATMLSGCIGNGFLNQPPQTYSLTVTATAGSLSKTTTLTLTVE
jgi:sugar lactone lactonase YvrE